MKLYVLKLKPKDTIFAISEYKSHMRLFILQNGFNINNYYIEKITDKKKINKYLIKYDDLYMMEYKNFIIRNIDKYYLEEIYYNMKKLIKDTLINLENINLNCIMDPKDHKTLTKTLHILEDNSKKKNLDNFINMNEIIRDYFNNHSIIDNLQDLNERYNFYLSN